MSGVGGGQSLLTSGAFWAPQLPPAQERKSSPADGIRNEGQHTSTSILRAGPEVPAAGLTHQLRRPGLGSWSVGHPVRSASAHGGSQGPLWGQASGTLAGQRWHSLPPTSGPYRPGPLEKGAAWFSLGKTNQSQRPHPCGVETLARPPCPPSRLWPGLLCVLSSGRPRPMLLAAGPSLPELRGHLLQEGPGPCSPTQAPSPDLPHGSPDVWPRITAVSPLQTPQAPREPAVYGTEEALPLRSLIHSPGQCAPLHLPWSRRQL